MSRFKVGDRVDISKCGGFMDEFMSIPRSSQIATLFYVGTDYNDPFDGNISAKIVITIQTVNGPKNVWTKISSPNYFCMKKMNVVYERIYTKGVSK